MKVALLALVPVVGCAAHGADATIGDLAGYWAGSATFRGAPLDISMRFDKRGDSLVGVFSAPDIMQLDQPIVRVSAASSKDVRFTLDAPEGALTFRGTRVADTIADTALLPS